MPDKPRISVDVLFNSRDGREFADQLGRHLNKVSRAWGDSVAEQTTRGWEAGTKIALSTGKTGDAIRKFVSSNIVSVYNKFTKELNAGNLAAAEKLERVLDKQVRNLEREADAIADAFESVQRRQTKTFSESADSFRDVLNDLRSGQIGGIGKGLTGRILEAGRARQGRAGRLAEMADQSKDPKAAAQAASMAKTGTAIANLGKGLMAFGAVAGALLVLVKIFADLEAKAIDMNKTLIEGAGALDFGISHAEMVSGGLRERLDELRGSTADLNRAFFEFGANAEEQQRILAALNQEGISFGRMTEGATTAAERMEKYQDVLATTLTYARALGVSTGEFSQKQGELMLETKLGFKEIAEQFSVITNEALRAGFTTKRFYSAVVEATSGMGFYGVRLEETAKLLANFDSLLGETVGGDAFKRLVGQYRDRGEQDKIRDILLKGQDFVRDELGEAFTRHTSALERDFAQRLGGDDVASMLAKMTEQQIRQTLEVRGFKPEEIRRFAVAHRLGASSRSGDLGAMMEAMTSAGPGFDIAMAMNASQVFQGRSVGEVARDSRSGGPEGAATRVALQEVADASGMKLEELTEMFETADQKWQNLTRMRDKIREGGGDRLKLSEEDQKWLATMAETAGVEINDQTGIISKDNVELREGLDLIKTSSVENAKSIADQFTRDQEIASSISENLYGLNDIMEQSISKILMDIYGVVSAIARKYLSGSPEMEKVQAIETARAGRLAAEGKRGEIRDQLHDIDRQLQGATGDDREKLHQRRQALVDADRQAQKDMRQAEVLEKAARKGPASSKTLESGTEALMAAGLISAPPVSAKGLGARAQEILGSGRSSSSSIYGAGEDARVVSFWEDIEPEDILGEMRERWEGLSEKQRQDFAAIYGGMGNVEAAFAKAQEAMEKAAVEIEGVFTTEAQEYELFHGRAAGAFEEQLLVGAGKSSMEASSPFMDVFRTIADNTAKQVQASEDATNLGLAGLFMGARKVNDMILPAGGGRPILTDERDTLMAMKPGGPIAQGMGGGRGGNTTVNIHGGDTRQIYNVVRRAMRATGNG
jgi:hypothetical protein